MGRTGRGVTAPAALWVCAAVLAGVNGWWTGVAVAVVLAGAFVGLGVWHAWRSRWPEDAVLERTGMDAVLFSHLVLGWTSAARSARDDPEHADHVWKLWVATARDPEDRSDGLTAENVDAELALLPRWDLRP
jgi:hypothetical protein